MKLVLDAHNHTLASGHAYSTIQEHVAEAVKTGMSLIAITEHGPSMPFSPSLFYYENAEVIPREIEGVRIMIGVELNILNSYGNVDLEDRVTKNLSPVIASFHPLCFKFSRHDFNEAEKMKECTEAVLNVMDNPFVHIIGHLDDPRYPVDIEAIVEKAVTTNTLLELNNASLKTQSIRVGSSENALKMLIACKKAQCTVVVGSDAHYSSYTGRLQDSIDLLRTAEFPEELVANTSVELFLSLLERKKKVC
jgi:putative hydrolase